MHQQPCGRETPRVAVGGPGAVPGAIGETAGIADRSARAAAPARAGEAQRQGPSQARRQAPSRCLVACLGHHLVGDDGAGLAVHDRLAGQPLPEGVRLLRLGPGGRELHLHLRGEELLVLVDAVALGGPAGALHVRAVGAPSGVGRPPVPARAISEMLAAARAREPHRSPRRVVLVGIEGRRFDALGTGLSPEVARAVPLAAELVEVMVGAVVA